MIVVDVTARFVREAGKLTVQDRVLVEAALKRLAEAFGDVHAHAGLGIRKLRKNLFECRAGLRLRVLFFAEPQRCLCFSVGDHEHVRRLIRMIKL